MELKGKVHRFGDDINTDEILPARYLNTSDPPGTGPARHGGRRPGVLQKARPGDFVVAGKNFGCGSSREHAPVALKALGLSGVIAASSPASFTATPSTWGWQISSPPGRPRQSEKGRRSAWTAVRGIITDLGTGNQYPSQPLPPFMQLLSDSELMAHLQKHLEAK